MTVEHVNLLPRNATALEKALAAVNDPLATLREEFNGIVLADRNPAPSLLPFLVWEYGLGELTPYLPNLYDVLSDGVRWQRIRGTPAAVYKGLGWLGYSGTIEEDPTRWRYWSGFQLDLDAVRGADVPDLDRIEGITSLSIPTRSRFYRGFEGYDVRAAETGHKRLGRSIVAAHSGVRLRAAGAKWSFGRSYSATYEMTDIDLMAMGVWIDPVDDGGPWSAAEYLWADADFPWATPDATERRSAIAAGVTALRAWVRFVDADGDTIGYARAVTHPVRAASGGQYEIGSTSWLVDSAAPTAVLVQARTPFGGGDGNTAAAMSVIFGGSVAPEAKPGALWLAPGMISGGQEVARKPVHIPFGATVRERVSYVLAIGDTVTPVVISVSGAALAGAPGLALSRI